MGILFINVFYALLVVSSLLVLIVHILLVVRLNMFFVGLLGTIYYWFYKLILSSENSHFTKSFWYMKRRGLYVQNFPYQ